MSRFDRYLLSSHLATFGFFALVLVGVYWINRAVSLFDQLIGDGQSALVFLEFSALSLPSVIKIVLPVAAFIAAVMATNRLITDSEMVVMQATGFSPVRMGRPVAIFGLIVALMVAGLAHGLVPRARAIAAAERQVLSTNITAHFLQEGQFMHPSQGVTLYLRAISPEGALLDLFLADDRNPARHVTYTAGRALFVKGDQGPKLIMLNGTIQVLTRADRRLSVTRFADFTYDLGALLTNVTPGARDAEALTTAELLWPTEALANETGDSLGRLRYDGHARLAEPFLALASALIGFAALLQGRFSRLGPWRQVVLAVVLLILVQGLATLAAAEGPRLAQGWALAYLAPLTGVLMGAGLLWWAGRPFARTLRATT